MLLGRSRGLIKHCFGDLGATFGDICSVGLLFNSGPLMDAWFLPASCWDHQGHPLLLASFIIGSCLFSFSARLSSLISGIISDIWEIFITFMECGMWKYLDICCHFNFQYQNLLFLPFFAFLFILFCGGVEWELILVKVNIQVKHYSLSYVFVLVDKWQFWNSWLEKHPDTQHVPFSQLTDPVWGLFTGHGNITSGCLS